MDEVDRIYRGIPVAGGIRVLVDGLRLLEDEPPTPRPVSPVEEARCESRLGLLAFAMLAYELGEIAAEELHQEFEGYIVARLPAVPAGDEWTLTGSEIRRWWQARRRATARRRRHKDFDLTSAHPRSSAGIRVIHRRRNERMN